MEVRYLELNTDLTRYGILGMLNEANTAGAILRLEVEVARTAREFYKIAEDLEQDEAALDLILLLKKESDLSSRR